MQQYAAFRNTAVIDLGKVAETMFRQKFYQLICAEDRAGALGRRYHSNTAPATLRYSLSYLRFGEAVCSFSMEVQVCHVAAVLATDSTYIQAKHPATAHKTYIKQSII